MIIMNTVKCVVVGDSDAEKTTLLYSYTTNNKVADYIPTVSDNYSANVLFQSLHDTAGQHDYDRRRPLTYPNTHVTPIKLSFRGESYTLTLFDTPGHDDYDIFRPLIYPDTDVILVCFSVFSRSSYEHVEDKWVPEIKHYCKNTPFVLVGTQIHLKNQSGSMNSLNKIKHELITFEKGEKLAKKIKAFKYVECSAITREGLNNVFDAAIEAALDTSEERKKDKCKCVLL